MAITQLITLGVEIILVALLCVVLVYLVRLHSRVHSLRQDYRQMHELIASLDAATVRAQSALATVRRVSETTESALAPRIGKGEELVAELRTMIETGDRVADRLLSTVHEVAARRRESARARAEDDAASERAPKPKEARAKQTNQPSAQGAGAASAAARQAAHQSGEATQQAERATLSRAELLSLQKLLQRQKNAALAGKSKASPSAPANSDAASLVKRLREVVGGN